MLSKILCLVFVVSVIEGRVLWNGGKSNFFATSQSTSTTGMINGECRIEDGWIYDGESKRQITESEQAQLSAYFQQLQQWQYTSTMSFMEKMKKSMRSMFEFQRHMYSRIFSGEMDLPFGSTPFFQMEPIPMMEMEAMPSPPCLCRSVPCTSRVVGFQGQVQPIAPIAPQASQPQPQPQPQPTQPQTQPLAVQARRPRSKRSIIYHQTASTASGTYPGRHRLAAAPKMRVWSSSKSVRFPTIIRSGSFTRSSHSTRYFKPSTYKAKKPTTVVYTQAVPSPVQYPTNTGLYTQPRTVVYSDPYTGGIHQHSTATGPGFSSVSHTYSYGNGGVPDTRSMMEMAGTQGMLDAMQREMDDMML